MPAALAVAAVAALGVPGLTAPPAAAAAGRPAGPRWPRASTGAARSPQALRELAGVPSGPRAAAAGAVTGIDVSSHEESQAGGINWAAVAGDGIRFAAIKATEGAYYANPYGRGDLTAARAAGLSTIAYAFAIPNGGRNGPVRYSGSPVVQADDLLGFLGADARTVPVALDIEYDPYVSQDGTNQCYGLRRPAMAAWVSAFAAEIRARTGRFPLVYTPPSWWATCAGRSTALGQLPLWVPDYSGPGSPALPPGWADWGLWQFTSSGTVTGIRRSVDVDEFNPDSFLRPGSLMLFNPGPRAGPAGSGSRVSLRVVALAEEARPAVTFSAAGLPPGLAISGRTGVIAGTVPAVPGAYPVTVTASDATSGVTGSVSFTWYAHGTIAVGPVPSQRTAAGTPVSLQLTAQDSVAGQVPSITAAGLPPGLSLSSGGLVTGWPGGKAATYHVTVRAADALGASASAAFTWSVTAAPVPGP